jgi:predicted RNA-binding protein with PIN domain
MPRVSPSDPEAKFCVSISRYFTSQTAAESYFLNEQGARADVTIEFTKWDEVTDEWIETDWDGYND